MLSTIFTLGQVASNTSRYKAASVIPTKRLRISYKIDEIVW